MTAYHHTRRAVYTMLDRIYRLKDEIEAAVEYGNAEEVFKVYSQIEGFESALCHVDGYEREYIKIHGLLSYYKPEYKDAKKEIHSRFNIG